MAADDSMGRGVEPENADQSLSQLALLFKVWKDLEAKGHEQEGERALDAQSSVMSLAELTPAQTLDDILYKLSFWRWDNALYTPGEASRSDRLVYSAFRDLARLIKDSNVVMPIDIETNFFLQVDEETTASCAESAA